VSLVFTTAEEAEDAFYDALGRGDLETLMGIWADDDEIVCIHPSGQSLSGHAAIRESWRSIFSNNTRFSIRIKRKVCWKGAVFAVHSVVEFLYLGNEPTAHGPMLSTNVFQRGAKGWRLLSHHTSTAASSENASEAADSQTRTLH
jgi:ketosteroid isomerase-like protein